MWRFSLFFVRTERSRIVTFGIPESHESCFFLFVRNGPYYKLPQMIQKQWRCLFRHVGRCRAPIFCRHAIIMYACNHHCCFISTRSGSVYACAILLHNRYKALRSAGGLARSGRKSASNYAKRTEVHEWMYVVFYDCIRTFSCCKLAT